ncbi:MAG TPA: hypothetical protein PK027_10870 [Aquimonas sp.]|jgi:hypothetical protein|nr:hypothetical protein [Aquimonas sp.]HRF54945.1 hypothetical protein [Aquimonas sp.]
MITDHEIASEVSRRVLEVNRLLNEAVSLVQERCPEAETSEFKQAVGSVLGALLLDVVNPLYRVHPQLAPPELYLPGRDSGISS